VNATAPAAMHPSVLHVSAAEGGGVDRYIRNVAESAHRRHFLWHTGSGRDVIEDIAARRFLPLADAVDTPAAPIALAQWLRANTIGMVHLHGVGERCRERLSLLQSARAIPWVVTLHDLTFIDPHAFAGRMLEPDLAWIAEISDTLAHAATVIAPSDYIRQLALRYFPNPSCDVIAPGIRLPQQSERASTPAEFSAQRPRHIVAVIGAIGPHKGSRLLDALIHRLQDTDIGIVVIGYLDSRLLQGWLTPGRCYVHGPYVDDELQGLISAYGADVALFPNRVPESFSYTLSEVWAAGLPVIAPDEGALGERVARHGGGWLLPARFSAQDAVHLLQRLFAPAGTAERARVTLQIDPCDPARIPTLVAMARDIDALYERFGLKPPSSDNDPGAGDEALRPLLAANLDGFAFRKELIKLAGEAVQLKAALEEARPWSAKLEDEIRQAQAWAHKLQHEIDILNIEGNRRFEENRRLLDDKAAFDQLPLIVRKLLLKKAFRARR
jgi:glycosyltransferase involved in cell wall biosynthesis